MGETAVDYALTTIARVKDRMTITSTDFDTELTRLINAATDFIESWCNRRFKSTSYAEKQSISVQKAKYIFLKQAPVTAITTIEWRQGLFNTPNYTEIPATDWDLLDDGKSGIVIVEGGWLSKRVNIVRINYVAGYLIDFANAGQSTHTLPADLTDLCERMISRWFKRRDHEGKKTEDVSQQGGGTITWLTTLNTEDKNTLDRYKRIPQFT